LVNILYVIFVVLIDTHLD